MFIYRLFWKDQELGFVEDVRFEVDDEGDGSRLHGRFAPVEARESVRPLYDFLSNGEIGDSALGNAWCDERNWWLLDDWGNRQGITIPDLWIDEEDCQGFIEWQWREAGG
jgi:hypothetical protein